MRLAAADVQWDTSTSATINADEILSLPNATTAPCWRQFSGYLTASATKQLFYWYHESVEDPASIRCRHRLATAAALSYEKAPLLLARRCRSRVALAAAQQVVYARNDSKRRKHDLALFHRVFKARQHYFTEAFRRKVSDRYQWLTFLRKAGGG